MPGQTEENVWQSMGGMVQDAGQAVAGYFGVTTPILESFVRKINNIAKKIGLTDKDWIVSTNDIISKIKELISKLRAENIQEANEISNAIAALPAGKSAILKDQISNKLKQLRAKANLNAKKSVLIDQTENAATQRALNLDYGTLSDKNKNADNIIKDVQDVSSKIEQLV